MPEITSNDVLFVLNGCEPVSLAGCEYAVCFKPADKYWSNSRQEFIDGTSWWPFQPAEVLILNEWGREPFGQLRKPDKWFTEFKYFDNLEAALACRAEVLAGPVAKEMRSW